MSILIKTLTRMGLLKDDLDHHLIRTSMVIICFFFGYQKWFDYEAQGLIPFFAHGPLIFWMVPCSASRAPPTFWAYRNGYSERCCWLGFGTRNWGYSVRSVRWTFLCTVTIIPFMPDGWAASAGGFPAMVGNVAFLMNDVVLLAVSIYLLRQGHLESHLGCIGGQSNRGSDNRTGPCLS